MIEPLLCGIVLGLVPITLLGLFASAWNQYISPILSIAPSPKIKIDIGVTINKANRGEGTH